MSQFEISTKLLDQLELGGYIKKPITTKQNFKQLFNGKITLDVDNQRNPILHSALQLATTEEGTYLALHGNVMNHPGNFMLRTPSNKIIYNPPNPIARLFDPCLSIEIRGEEFLRRNTNNISLVGELQKKQIFLHSEVIGRINHFSVDIPPALTAQLIKLWNHLSWGTPNLEVPIIAPYEPYHHRQKILTAALISIILAAHKISK